jgi:hypothetical protein
MDLLSGDDNYSAALPAPPAASPAAPAAVVIASPERVAAAPQSSKAAPSAAAASSNAPASRVAVSFTVRGLVELLPSSQGLFDKQTRSGAGGGWGGLKKAMNQVVGERQGSLQISLGRPLRSHSMAGIYSSRFVTSLHRYQFQHSLIIRLVFLLASVFFQSLKMQCCSAASLWQTVRTWRLCTSQSEAFFD